MKKCFLIFLFVLLLASVQAFASAPEWIDCTEEELAAMEAGQETVIEPVKPVPVHVRRLLEIARAEIGYTEGRNNATLSIS